MLIYANTPQAGPAVSEYRGTCDASAAVSLGHDYFIVANYEDNSLRIYRFGNAYPIKACDLSTFANADSSHPEMDIEAAAKIGSRVYWITSHGANRKAKDRPGRQRFFATDISFKEGQPVITPVGGGYSKLLEDMANAPQLKKYHLESAALIPPKDEGGLNIEGLAATPSGGLLVGFRNPIPGGNALIVTLNNPGDVIQGKRADIGPVFELPLGGHGIRSIEWNSDHYLIVAGSHNGNKNSRLFRWQGPGTAPPSPELALGFGDLNPESLFVSSQGHIYILSDDGTKEINSTECKNLPVEEQRFRAIAIKP